MPRTPHAMRLGPIGALALCIAGCGDEKPAPLSPCQALTERGGVTVGSYQPGDPASPAPASLYRAGQALVTARTYLVIAGNPLASKAGCEILEAGGTAVDA